MPKLSTLIEQHGANAFVLADAGNGSGIGEAGRAFDFDDAATANYGAIELAALPAPVTSSDGVECSFASDWIEAEWRGEFRPANPYRFRVMF